MFSFLDRVRTRADDRHAENGLIAKA